MLAQVQQFGWKKRKKENENEQTTGFKFHDFMKNYLCSCFYIFVSTTSHMYCILVKQTTKACLMHVNMCIEDTGCTHVNLTMCTDIGIIARLQKTRYL